MTAGVAGVESAHPMGASNHAARTMIRLFPSLRAEEFIAHGRVILGLGLLLAVTGDDKLPREAARAAESLVIAYSLLAGIVLVSLYLARLHMVRFRGALHAVDIAVLAALLILTGGAGTGYFSPLFFPIASGALRWRQRGVVWTGVVVLLVFAGIAASDYFAGQLQTNAWLVRKVALIATVLLIAEMGAVESRYIARILQLSRWPKLDTVKLETLANELLTRATALFRARRAVLVLEDSQEPWYHVFLLHNGQVTYQRSPLTASPVIPVGPPLDRYPFLFNADRGSVLYLDDKGPRVQRKTPVAEWLQPTLDDAPLIGVPLRRDSVNGHIFLLDISNVAEDDLRLADLLGRQAADTLEQFALAQELRHVTAARERARVSRDLHDGVLQTLSGIALKLASVRSSPDASPQTREQLGELERLMLDEQRSLRFFTEELRHGAVAGDTTLLPVDALVGLIHRLERIWSVKVAWDPMEVERVPARLASDVYRLVHEAIVNAARHGQARNIRLCISAVAGTLHIVVTDDGAGFPFVGKFSMSELAAARRGPRTLRERVHELGGQLYLTSSRGGSEIEIILRASEASA